MGTFAAIDFETANQARDSACAVGVVLVSRRRIVVREHFFIRPRTRRFILTGINGLTWKDVRDAPSFREIWPELRPLLRESDFIAAHSAGFDRSVLSSCCDSYGLRIPNVSFICTMKLARMRWGIHPTTLPSVCRALRIRFQDHHDALADAEACANIVIAAQRDGWSPRKELN